MTYRFKKTWRYKHAVGLVSDTHTGDAYSIWPPDFVTLQGNEIKQNPAQKKLWEYWLKFRDSCEEFQVEEIWHLGDMMQGQNHREQGLGLLTTDMGEQRRACAKIHEPLIKVAKKYYPKTPQFKRDPKGFFRVIGGTGYHQGAEPGQWPEQVVTEEMLGGRYHGPILMRQFSDSGRVFVLFHGGGGAFMYPETQAGREMFALGIAESIGIYDKHVDCVICGHLHHASMHIEKYGQHFIRLGCWQIWSGNKFGFNPLGLKQPKCTAGILLLDEFDRIRYIQFDYKPMPKVWDVVRTI